MKGLRWVALVVTLAATGMCAAERYQEAARQETELRQPLDLYRTELPNDAKEQAQLALQREAHRRQLRFIDAVRPGHRFGTTRIEQMHIEHGELSVEQLYDVGAQLFHHRFEARDGFGGRDRAGVHRVHHGERGGPDAHSCADCHRRGGIAGAGDSADNAYYDGDGDRPGSAFERNPISLAGAGLTELLAREMTRALQAQRDDLLAAARSSKSPQQRPLSAKGISFGELSSDAGGRLDFRGVRGVDRDLVVRPFGHKGHTAALRDMIEQQLALHHGMQSEWLVRQTTPHRAVQLGPFGGDDPDGDGVRAEINEGQVTALTLFLAMQELPQLEPPTDPEQLVLWAKGQQQFETLGCANCHAPSLQLDSASYELLSRGGGPALRIDLSRQAATPRVEPASQGAGYRVMLYSDLKRHVVGPNLRETRRHHGVSPAEFLTRPLWGLMRSAPYLHDGRAPTVEHAILEHSGEASDSRERYAGLSDEERAPLRVFLASLTRAQRVIVP